MKKRILTALLATSMVLASAPAAFAADVEVVLDPLGIVYEMGDDNILTETDGEIDHGDSVYLLLVDESNGDPSELKSDDVRNLRIYTDWEVGESRVNDEDILYKKAEDVLVSSSAVPDTTYALNVTLTNLPGGSLTTPITVTKTGGEGYTADEIDNLTTAQKQEILQAALSGLKTSDLETYQKLLVGNQYEKITNPLIDGSTVYANTTELTNAGITYVPATSGFTYTDTATSTTVYFSSPVDAVAYLTGTLGYINADTTPLYRVVDQYYKVGTENASALSAAVTEGLFSRDNTPHLYKGSAGAYTYVPLSNSVDVVDLPSSEVALASAVNWSTSKAYTVESDTTPTTLDAGDEFIISLSNSTDLTGYNTTPVANLSSLTGYIVPNADTNTYSTAVPNGYYLGTSSAYYNGNTYYPTDTDALATLTKLTTGYYKDGVATVADLSTLFPPTDFYANTTAVTTGGTITTADIKTIDDTAASAWRVIATKAEIPEATVTATADTAVTAILPNANNYMTIAQGAVAGTSTTSTRAGTVTLAGPDYYYFVEIDTKTYSGANEYDLVGFVSVGSSRNDAEDKGSSEIAVVLTAGNYDGGTPQSGDIDIYGENNAIVEFEDDADEIYILWDNEAMFIVDVDGQDELNLGYNTDFNSTFADRHGYANIDFLNFVAQPRFNRTGEFYIYADEDMYIYQLNDEGFAEEINGLDYDEDEEAWNFRTNHLTSYVIADEELVLTDEHGDFLEPDDATEQPPVIGKPNPGTGR